VASRWNAENFGRFVLFFALAMVASAMKIEAALAGVVQGR